MTEPSFVLSADRSFVKGAAATLRSALVNLSAASTSRTFILSHRLSAADRDLLTSATSDLPGPPHLTFLEVPMERLAGVRTMRFINEMSFARLLIGELLPATVRRCVYLDTDIIVERDLAPLFRMDLGTAIVGAVPEPDADFRRQQVRDMFDREGDGYFNTGFMVIDLERWRAEDVGGRALEYCIREQPPFVDQNALNFILHDAWLPLDETWNSWAKLAPVHTGRLLHFTGAPKPWDVDYTGRFSERFFHYLDQTASAGWRPRDPLGMKRLLSRIRRHIPHLPAVRRAIETRMRRSST